QSIARHRSGTCRHCGPPTTWPSVGSPLRQNRPRLPARLKTGGGCRKTYLAGLAIPCRDFSNPLTNVYYRNELPASDMGQVSNRPQNPRQLTENRQLESDRDRHVEHLPHHGGVSNHHL